MPKGYNKKLTTIGQKELGMKLSSFHWSSGILIFVNSFTILILKLINLPRISLVYHIDEPIPLLLTMMTPFSVTSLNSLGFFLYTIKNLRHKGGKKNLSIFNKL